MNTGKTEDMTCSTEKPQTVHRLQNQRAGKEWSGGVWRHPKHHYIKGPKILELSIILHILFSVSGLKAAA